MRTVATLAAVLASLGVAAHVPDRCAPLTDALQRESLDRGEILKRISASTSDDEVLRRVTDLLRKDGAFADALNRWIMCVAEVE